MTKVSSRCGGPIAAFRVAGIDVADRAALPGEPQAARRLLPAGQA